MLLNRQPHSVNVSNFLNQFLTLVTSYVTTLNEILIKCPILSNKVWLDIVWFFFQLYKRTVKRKTKLV